MVENVGVIRRILCQLYNIDLGSWQKILNACSTCMRDQTTSELKKSYSVRFGGPLRELALHHAINNPYRLSNTEMAGLYDELANQIISGMKRGLFDNEPQVDQALLAMLAADEFIPVSFGPYRNSIMT